MSREEVWFDSGGDRCVAWLHRPDLPRETGAPHGVQRVGSSRTPAYPGNQQPLLPAVVLAPGLAGVRAARIDDFGATLAQAGMVALVFDYRGFGGSEGRPRQLMTVRRQLADWHAAVAAARATPGVDPARVGLWGGSITGGHVIRVAAEDATIAAVVSHVPLVDGLSCTAAVRPAPRQQLRLTVLGVADALRGLTGRNPSYVGVVGPPSSAAILTSPDAEPDYRAVLPDGWDNRIAARAALSLLAYQPGRSARRVRCPMLVTLARQDAITPPRRAERLTRRAPDVEVRWYDARHFTSFAAPTSEPIMADAVAFLGRHLQG